MKRIVPSRATSTVLGIAGTDLVLPAVPTLPEALGGDLERAQLVLAAFVAGSACGLLGFGALGSRFDQRGVLYVSLLGYALISAAASLSPSLDVLVALRFLQGAAGSAAAVFAPGMLRALYGDAQAVALIVPQAPDQFVGQAGLARPARAGDAEHGDLFRGDGRSFLTQLFDQGCVCATGFQDRDELRERAPG